MMKTAVIWAEQSYCKRQKVGSVISKNGRIISIGYNGTVSGSDNCCECECDECNGVGNLSDGIVCKKCNGIGNISRNTVVHAEANALMFATKNGIKTEDCSIYITLSPCIECAKIIIQSGIKEVIYLKEYRDNQGIVFLKEQGIKVRSMKI